MKEFQDIELLRQYVRNNADEAFAALVARHANMVYSVAWRKTGNPAAAEEVTQAVFVILARKANGLLRHTALSGWLYQAARLTAANFLRTEIRRAQREQEACMQSLSNQTQPEIWPQIMPLLEDAMGRLGEKDRNTLALRFFEGKNFGEIGTALGVSENAARKRTHYALEKLRMFFSKRGVVSTAETIAGAISANSVQAAPIILAKTATSVALAKGATASTSTLTLIKGALKSMAWIKAKTAIVIGATALLGIGTTTTVVEALLPEPDVQGTWEGMSDLPGWGVQAGESPQSPVVLKINRANGNYQVTADIVWEGIKDVPFSSFTYQFPHIHGEVPLRHVSYDGTVNRAGTMISGTVNDSHVPGTNYSEPLVFHRTDHPTPVPEPLTDAEFAPRAGSDLQGLWAGMIDSLHINIKIAESSNGTFRADFYSLDQGGSRQPTSVHYDKSTVKITPMAGFGMFQGELRNGGKEMSGDWIQNGLRIPATFTRAN